MSAHEKTPQIVGRVSNFWGAVHRGAAFFAPAPLPDPRPASQHRGARGAITYFALASATAVSSMRFEKPHSLSYQLDTFTRRPDTLVSVASNVDEAGLWLKSIDTSGALLYPRMPFSAP